MRETHEYLMPDYYPRFLCKMGACRAACCENWPVSLSMEDYFRLVGLPCRKGLRQKLDCALHLKSRPTPESYAEIAHRFDGSCPVRMDDGRCALQAELGEGEGGADSELGDYRKKIAQAKLPDDVRERLEKEVSRLAKQPYGSSEATVMRNYLDVCLELPWGKKTEENLEGLY